MDIDFTIGNERESLGPLHHQDDGMDQIMASYSGPGPSSKPAPLPNNEPGYLRQLVDQMQINAQAQMGNQLSWIMQKLSLQENKQAVQTLPHQPSNFNGLSLSINKDVLRWVVLAIFIIALIVILLQVRKQNLLIKRFARRNPIKYLAKKKYLLEIEDEEDEDETEAQTEDEDEDEDEEIGDRDEDFIDLEEDSEN